MISTILKIRLGLARRSLNAVTSAATHTLRWAVAMLLLGAFTSVANATLVGLKECTCTNLTLELEGFPNVSGEPWTAKIGGNLVRTVRYSFTDQTMVVSRLASLPGGKYWVEIFRDGVLFAN